jgi:hypothetical protein
MENTQQTKDVPYWMEHKPNAMFSIDAEKDPDKRFFKWWCIFLTPFVKLTPKEIDLIASLLKQRYELSKKISDPSLVDSLLMSKEVQNKVIEECHITQSHFYVITSNLRKNNILTPSGINPKLIPNIRRDDNGYFQLLILFKDPEIKHDL